MNGASLTIMMLGGARRVAIADQLRNSAQRMGLDVKMISYELFEEVPIACIAKVVVGLKWSDPQVAQHIASVAIDNEVDIILPFVDGSIEIAAKCRELLPNVFIPVSGADIASIMFDKILAAKAFKEAELPIPHTYSILNAEVPAIAKPRHGSASRGIKIFYNIEDLMHLDNLSDYLIQEYIENAEEFTVDCYVTQQGTILCTVPRQRLEVMGGEVTRTCTVRIPELIEFSRKTIEAFDLRGPVTLQFLRDPASGRFLLMEVNPRLGGGVVCSVYAGAPITDYIIREARGAEVIPCDDWADNTLMTRYLKEVIFHNN